MGTYINLICETCNKSFGRTSKDIASTRLKNQTKNYCSKSCYHNDITQKIKLQCLQCNETVFKAPSVFKKVPNTFCSKSCAATYNNTHKTKGTRRSKLEVYLESQIRETYPNINVLCNDKTVINSELDFYFPELQLAIELNGILHFEPIYGDSKLTQIQTNDNKKAFLCNQQQINLAVVDVSSCKYLNQSSKDKFWNIVDNIINSIIS